MKKIKKQNISKRFYNLLMVAGLMAVMAFASCNKYEDGPIISLRTKKERVANTWVIYMAMRNGEDVTEDYDEYTIYMNKDGDAELAALYTLGDFSYEYDTDGTWEFQNDAENLNLDFEDDDADVTYQILRLKEKELWLRELGGEDELHLVPK